MWKLFNTLFGWHYVLIRSKGLDYRYVRKVKKDASGDMFISFVPGDLWYLLDTGETDNGYYWKPLTW